jgi:hypothetical protein
MMIMQALKNENRVNPMNFRKSTKSRTFQEIYDFCRLNTNYHVYFEIPEPLEIKDQRRYKYYYNSLNKPYGQSRKGTYIYAQSMNEMERFMGNTTPNFHIHIDRLTYEIIDRKTHDFDLYERLYITTSIEKNGVRIEFDDPFYKTRERYRFIARSHHSYDEKGVVEEVKACIEKNMLFPEGRWRDLQIVCKVRKEDFAVWYKTIFKVAMTKKAVSDHNDMVEKYTPKKDEKEFLDYEEAENILACSGFFFDFGIDDEFSRDEVINEFMELCNK